MRTICFILLLSGTTYRLYAQDLALYRKSIFRKGKQELPFRLLSPVATNKKSYPLIIFLHGGFEKGNDNIKQLAVGGTYFASDSIRKNYPAYVLFPQCPADDSWAYFENTIDYRTGKASDWLFPFNKRPTNATKILKMLIDSLRHSGTIDSSAIYIAGVSQGGMGVLDMIARYPQLFSAGISICGAGDPNTARSFAGKVALWLFHGEKDEVVPVDFSRDFARRLRRYRNTVRYTEFPGVGHNSWEQVFTEPGLLDWLFQQHKH